MKIGLTYDLRSDYLKEGYSEEETAEFDKESTVEDIEGSLHKLGHSTERIGHVRNLINRIVSGERWDLIFNICEGLRGIGREAQVPAVLDAYDIPYTFSDPLVLALTLHKGMTKRVVRDAGIPTPDFALVRDEKDIDEVNLPYPLFVKPNAEGSGKGINRKSRVGDPSELRQVCLDQLKHAECLLVETYLPGREFTVGIVGTGRDSFSVGLMEVCFRPVAGEAIYSYEMKTNYEENIDYSVPEPEIAEKCIDVALRAWRVLECRDAGRIDIRMDKNGIPNFIEVNPLAGLNNATSDLPILARMNGYDYDFIIHNVIRSAGARIKK